MSKKDRIRAVRIFPLLYDISPFVVKEHPVIHPDSALYLPYWEGVEKRCVEGLWGLDRDEETGKGGWRYMPANLYYYVNCCVIVQQDKTGNTTTIKSPLLRDVEWILSYGWLTARGFSGFEDDDEYTSHKLVEKLEKGKDLSFKEKERFKEAEQFLRKSDGELKKYVEAREYLYKTHDESLGLPIYDNLASNLFVLGSRGFGKSFFVGNAIIGHEFTFYGSKRYDESYLSKPKPVEIFVGASQGTYSNDLLNKFIQSKSYQTEELGAYGSGEDFITGFFHTNTKGSLHPNNKAKGAFEHYYKNKANGEWQEGGSKTKIIHGIYTTENPQVAVGTRPTVMAIEEVGLLHNVLSVHSANETCMIRETKFGSAIYIGTSGNMRKIEESKTIFEDPEVYNFVPYKDHWEDRQKPIGLFIPAYYVDKDFKDNNGNTNIEESLKEELYQREKRRKAANSLALDGYVMARPLVPSEMFLSPTANIFPTARIRERLVQVEIDDLWNTFASVGRLEWDGPEKKAVKWKEDVYRDQKPITTLNLDAYQGKIEGTIVVYEHPPEWLPAATYYNNLYKIVYDPIKDDNGGTSLASILVYKGFSDNAWEGGMQDTIVAEYIGRYMKVNDIHEIAIKLALYFNAKVLVETNIPDFVRYCKMNNYYHILQYSPWVAISKAIKNPGKKYEVGVTMSAQLGVHCEQLIRQLLLEIWKKHKDSNLLFLDKILSLRLLRELISYDRDKNMDHVSSLKLLALWLSQEKLAPVQKETKKEEYDLMDNYLKSQRREYSSARNPFYRY